MAEERQNNGSAEEKLDFSTLEDRLEELDSTAFIQAERECRMAADPTPDIMYSAAFRGRLAATAMNVPYEEIRRLKLQDYTAVISRVLAFLLQTLGETVTRRNS